MEQHHDLHTTLHLLKYPAFLVDQGIITAVNHAAAAWLLQPGQAFPPMLVTGSEEYETFAEGSLFVTLSMGGINRDACVTRMAGGDLVTVELTQSQETLQALGRAATTLRKYMDGLMTTAEQFLPAVTGEDAHLQHQAAQMNRRLYQMLRLVDNMNFVADAPASGSMETTDIGSFLQEILDKTSAQSPHHGQRLASELPSHSIFTQINQETLERAVFHMLSNAFKYSPEDSQIQFRLTQKHHRLFLSVSNTLSDPDLWIPPHNHFLRQPSMSQPHEGMGLGILLLQTTAAAHGGALLVERIGDMVRFTLTLPVLSSRNTQVRSPIVPFDYAGERDHCLLELSDVLPVDAYKPENLK